jgi:hypothetical protein
MLSTYAETVFKNSVSTSQEILLNPNRDQPVDAAYCENGTKLINAEFLNVKAGGTYIVN